MNYASSVRYPACVSGGVCVSACVAPVPRARRPSCNTSGGCSHQWSVCLVVSTTFWCCNWWQVFWARELQPGVRMGGSMWLHVQTAPNCWVRSANCVNCAELLQTAANCAELGGRFGCASSNVSAKLYGVGPTLEFKLQHMYRRFVVSSAISVGSGIHFRKFFRKYDPL